MRGGYRGAYKKSQIREKFLLDPSLRNLKKTQMGGQTSSKFKAKPSSNQFRKSFRTNPFNGA
tara:strand:- start:261 stop:446 length:186 start_codon:yes stop_codon:yes gene_type:complete